MNKDNILLLLSELAYKRNSRIKEEVYNKGLGNVFIREVKDLKYITIIYNDEIYIGIRGSASKNNWIRNVMFWKTKTEYGKIHNGFYKGARLLADDILKILRNTDKKVNVGGHSLGASLASIVGMILENEYKLDIGRVRAFAEPSYTDNLLYDFKFDYLRYYNNLDAIYMTSLFTEKDLSNTIYIKNNGELIINPTNSFINNDKKKSLKARKDLKEIYKDHEVLLYRKHLWI